MKALRALFVAGCVLALSSGVWADDWRVAGHVRGGYGYGYSGFGVNVSGDGWGVSWSSGYSGYSGYWPRRGYDYGTYYPVRVWVPRPGYWYYPNGYRPVVHTPPPVVYAPPVVRPYPYVYYPYYYPYGYTGYPYGLYPQPFVVGPTRVYVKSGAPAAAAPGVWVVPGSGAPDGTPARLDGLTPPPFEPGVRDVSAGAGAINVPLSASDGGFATLAESSRVANPEQTEREFRRLLSRNPDDARLYYANAWVFFLNEKYLPGALMLRRALDLDPGMGAAGRAVLTGFYDTRTTGVALVRLDAHVKGFPDDREARLLRAYVRFIEGQREAARSDLDLLLKARKDDVAASRLMGLCASQ